MKQGHWKWLAFPLRFHRQRISEVEESCSGLRAIGLDVRTVERGRPEERITLKLGKSTGLIEISREPIRLVNVLPEKGGMYRFSTYYNVYLVPAPNVRSDGYLELRSTGVKGVPVLAPVVDVHWRAIFVKIRSIPLFGRVPTFGQTVDDRWKGTVESNLVARMNEDILLKQSLIGLNKDVMIRSVPDWGWAMSSSQCALSRELWDCYTTIARHLLESSGR